MKSTTKYRKRLMEVSPGIFQIDIPIPIKSLRSVFVYLVHDGAHNLLIDTGWPSEDAFSALETSLAEINVSLNEIETIVISHLHPDHFGLAEQIKDHNQTAKVIMHEDDAKNILSNYDEYKALINNLHQWLEHHGTPLPELRAMLDASTEMLRFFRPPNPTNLVNGGENVKVGNKWNFEVIPTPGHTKGTICLRDFSTGIFFSGDHILPTITPNISLGPFYMGDPLGDYLDSLERVTKIETDLVLPSHEHIFSDLRKRVGEILEHHKERLEETITCLGEKAGNSGGLESQAPLSAYEVASKLQWHSGSWESLGPWERRAAVMETLAHLEYLIRKGRVAEIEESKKGKSRIEYTLTENRC